MSSQSAPHNHGLHDLSPSAVLAQTILPAQARIIVVCLEAIFILAIIATGFFAFRGVFAQRELLHLTAVKNELTEQKTRFDDKLKQRSADHKKASEQAAWIRRNMPMQPLAVSLMNALPANVVLLRIEADIADGGAPQMTIKMQLNGEPDAVQRAISEVNRVFEHMGVHVLNAPIPQKMGRATEFVFPVQFPFVEEISFDHA